MRAKVKQGRERKRKAKEGKGQERKGRRLQMEDKQEAKKLIRGDGWISLFLSVGVVGSVLESFSFLFCLPVMAFLLVFILHQPFCQIQLCGKLACRVGQDAAVT